jgi:hypothetical protein
MQTQARRGRIVRAVQQAQFAHPVERRAYRHFADAVLALSDDPGRDNLERYLAASRALEESRRAGQLRSRRRRRRRG